MKIYCFDRERNVSGGQKGITKFHESWQERDARPLT